MDKAIIAQVRASTSNTKTTTMATSQTNKNCSDSMKQQISIPLWTIITNSRLMNPT